VASHPLAPLFADLSGRRVLVTGAGRVACDTAEALLAHGAEVLLVAPTAPALVARAGLTVLEASPTPAHLDACVLLVAASEDPQGDADVLEAARARPLLALTPGRSDGDTHLGAVRARGSLAVAVTTRGVAPELEGRLAADAAASWTDEHEALARILGDVRDKLARRFPDPERRASVWASLLDPNSPVLALLKAGDEDDAIELAERMAWGTG
jgi:uroporphyrin-III C-methyltransferase/precorrin-2 dehydrogenase/sirohydrochlorin ferrochelatase